MLKKSLPSAHQIYRQFPRGLQDRQLAVGIRHDDVNFRDEKYPVADAALRDQNMPGNRSHVLDAPDTANKKLRHYGRFHNIQRHDFCLPAGVVVLVAGKENMHGTKPYTNHDPRNNSGFAQPGSERGKFITTILGTLDGANTSGGAA